MEEIIALAIILITAFMFAPLGLGGGFLFVPTLWELFIQGLNEEATTGRSLKTLGFLSFFSSPTLDPLSAAFQ